MKWQLTTIISLTVAVTMGMVNLILFGPDRAWGSIVVIPCGIFVIALQCLTIGRVVKREKQQAVTIPKDAIFANQQFTKGTL